MEDSGLEKNFQVEDHPVQYFIYTVEGTKTQRGPVICLKSQSKEKAAKIRRRRELPTITYDLVNICLQMRNRRQRPWYVTVK